MKSDDSILEREINKLITKKFKANKCLVLREIKLPPCEMDIIVLDPVSLCLFSFEIKRNKWDALLKQAIRTKLYCHYSFAVMPNCKRNIIPINKFVENGIGVAFYSKNSKNLELTFEHESIKSSVINRILKQEIYIQFYNKYGELL